MAPLPLLALLFCAGATLMHLASTGLMIHRCRTRNSTRPNGFAPAVTILRPLCGVDPLEDLTLRSSFDLSYPNYDLIFCCARADDPVVPLVRRLMADYPHVPAQLLIGEDTSTPNPKLGNLIKGWHAARSPWTLMADSNVLMPPDYIERMLAGWLPDTGLICSPPIGCMPRGFWAELECAFLNGFQARWQYLADGVGLGFAQGKSMLWRRADLELAGGIRALAGEIAEDAAATKVVRQLGLRVRLVRGPFGQPLGSRTIRQVWARQLRWARLRRVTFPIFFIPELFAGSFFPILAGTYGACSLGLSPLAVLLMLGAVWFGCEALLTKAAGWHLSIASPFAWALRDLALPLLWANAWTGNSFTWRGNKMHLDDAPSKAEASAGPAFES